MGVELAEQAFHHRIDSLIHIESIDIVAFDEKEGPGDLVGLAEHPVTVLTLNGQETGQNQQQGAAKTFHTSNNFPSSAR